MVFNGRWKIYHSFGYGYIFWGKHHQVSLYLGKRLGTFAGPGSNGQVVQIISPEPRIGKYVVIQLKEESQVLNIIEVKVKVIHSGKVVGRDPAWGLPGWSF